MSAGVRINENERSVLVALSAAYHDEGNCLYFRTIADETGLELKQVRRAVRSLARKGLAEYHRGLFNDDGVVAGSGYCCTLAGKALAAAQEPQP